MDSVAEDVLINRLEAVSKSHSGLSHPIHKIYFSKPNILGYLLFILHQAVVCPGAIRQYKNARDGYELANLQEVFLASF